MMKKLDKYLEYFFGENGFFSKDHSSSRSILIICTALFLLLVISYSAI